MPEKPDSPQGLVPGRKPVRELLANSPEKAYLIYVQEGKGAAAAQDVLDLCRQRHIRYKIVPKAELDRLYPGNHQGVIAKIFSEGFVDLDDLISGTLDAPLPLIVALDQVQDPGNVGAVARTLYALGGGGILLPKFESAGLGPGAYKASAGALDRLPVAMVPNLARALEDCSERDFAIYCAQAGENGQNVFTAQLRTPAVLVLGSEGKGIRPGVAKRCGGSLFIPFRREFDSLNVAQAGAIIIARFAALC